MKNSRNIFSTLVLEQNPSYVEELEKKYNIELPPVFKAFVQTFEFGKFQPLPEHKIVHPNKELGYENFNTSLEKAIKVYFTQDDFYTAPNFLPIIISGMYHNGICLELKSDKIYLYEDFDDYTEISKNILSLISNLKQIHWNSI